MDYNDMARYGSRSVLDWVAGIDSGAFVLPSFQRSLVWNNWKTASYLEALFENRPTGLFLTLEAKQTNGKLQFTCRPLKSVEERSIDDIKELILDGQQRLTTLWRALNWQVLWEQEGEKNIRRFYAKVETFDDSRPKVIRIEPHSKSRQAKALRDPKVAYQENLVPVDILLNKKMKGASFASIPEWCMSVHGGDSKKFIQLEESIRHLANQLLLERVLHYCVLNAEIDRNVAVDIFLETNKSSVTVKWFDIAVAIAEGDHGENLREHISDFHGVNPGIAHYFNRDKEKMIPQLGEWLLKVTCLTIGKPPKEKHYEDAVASLYKGSESQKERRLKKLQRNLKSALETAARHGAPNHRTLPSWPPIHVIAALQDDISSIRTPGYKGVANELISAYLWRAFFTDRYEAQADARLFEDFVKLKRCLENIKSSGCFSRSDDKLPNIFQDNTHPLPDAGELVESASWINQGRLGKAIVALSLHQSPAPSDWATKDKLDPVGIRDLEDARNLDRHHIFPAYFMKGSGVSERKINNGLNGVLLSKATNQSFSKKDPKDYLSELELAEAKLQERVESHLVPYDALLNSGEKTKKERYYEFLQKRADLIVAKINELAKIP